MLRYHGSKWRIAPWVISHFPGHQTYVEPFAGGASVLLRKARCAGEVVNDLNGDVVNLFRVLRDPQLADHLVASVTMTPYAREELERSREVATCPVERARRFLVRSWFSLGTDGATRQSNAGFRSYAFSDKVGSLPVHQWSRFPWHLQQIAERLRGVIIENDDALEVIARYDSPGTLFYVDPPYVESTRTGNRGMYSHEMTDADHERLAALLNEVQGMVVVSGYASALYDDRLFASWRRVEREARTVAANERVEVLWIKPHEEESNGRLFF